MLFQANRNDRFLEECEARLLVRLWCLCENFINKKVVDELRLKIFGAKTNVAMASQAFSVKVPGKVKETLKLKGRTYDKLTLGVVPKQCADIVLGQAFMRQHEEVVFKLGGSKKGLVVAHLSMTRLVNFLMTTL